jgi:hypothetical protein
MFLYCFFCGLSCQFYLSWCFKVYFGSFWFEMDDSESFYTVVSWFILSVLPQLMFKMHFGSFSFETYDWECFNTVVSWFILSVFPQLMFQNAFWKFLVWSVWLRMFLYCCVVVYLVSVTSIDVSKCILEVSRMRRETQDML